MAKTRRSVSKKKADPAVMRGELPMADCVICMRCGGRNLSTETVCKYCIADDEPIGRKLHGVDEKGRPLSMPATEYFERTRAKEAAHRKTKKAQEAHRARLRAESVAKSEAAR